MCVDRCCRQLYQILHAARARQRALELTRRATAPSVPSSASAAPAQDADVASTADSTTAEAAPSSSSSSSSAATADELVPSVIWCLLQCNPPHIHSHLSFIRRFRPDIRVQASLAYHLTVVESAVMFVGNATAADFEGVNEAHFLAGLRQGEERARARRLIAEQLQESDTTSSSAITASGATASDAGATTPADGGDASPAPLATAGARDVASSSSTAGPSAGGGAHSTLVSGIASARDASAPAALGFPPLGIGVLAPPPTALELPLHPPLPEPTWEALAAWRRQRLRFVGRAAGDLRVDEVSELLAEYEHLAATCRQVAAVLGLPPPDVSATFAPPE